MHIRIHLYPYKETLKRQKHKKLRPVIYLGVREHWQMGDKDGRERFHCLPFDTSVFESCDYMTYAKINLK